MTHYQQQGIALPLIRLSLDEIRTFFIDHLDRLYHAKQYSAIRLPQLAELAHFSDLRNAVLEIRDEVLAQIVRMDEIYSLLGTKFIGGEYAGWIGLINDALKDAQNSSDSVCQRDLSILFYMQNIEALESASFNMLSNAADHMGDEKITQLLKECFDEADSDRRFMMTILGKYISG